MDPVEHYIKTEDILDRLEAITVDWTKADNPIDKRDLETLFHMLANRAGLHARLSHTSSAITGMASHRRWKAEQDAQPESLKA